MARRKPTEQQTVPQQPAKDQPMSDNAPDFNGLLDKPSEDFERPKPMPVGTYLGLIAKFEYDKAKNDKKTPFVRFTIVPQEALPDVDEDALTAALNGEPLSTKLQRHELYITGDAMWRLGQFLVDHAGTDSGIPTREQIDQAVGKLVTFTIIHTPNKKDPEAPPYANIGVTGKPPE